VSAPFQRYGTLVAGSLKTIALRVLSFFGPTLNAFFKRVLIKAPKTLSGVSLNRRLSLDYAANTLTIEDEITGMQPGDKLYTSPAVSFRLVPSARFYQPGEAQAFQRAVTEKLDGNTFTRTVVLDDDSEIVLLSK
jgi:hypothetical protein